MLQRVNKIFFRAIVVGFTALVFTVLHILSFYPHQADAQQDCIVVFGAAVWPGNYGPVPSHALTDRTLAAVSIYEQGLAQCIVLSGGDSIYGAHEVDIMTDILLAEGVPEGVIELDRVGVNTRATIDNLPKDRSYILVSNDFHLARIGLLAQRYDLGVAGFTLHGARYQSGGRYSREPYFVFREAVAFWYYFFVTLV